MPPSPPCAPANAGGLSRLQSPRLKAAVAELGKLYFELRQSSMNAIQDAEEKWVP